jgi:long-chain acyl-CoA synthetase
LLSLVHVADWRAAVTPDVVALSDHLGARLTYRELATAMETSAARLAAAGIGPGDVVPVLARNQAGWITALLGLIRAGALPAAVNWRLAPAELGALLTVLRPAALVTDGDCAPLARQAADGHVPVLNLREVSGNVAGPASAAVPARPAERLRGPEPAILLHTSGTTGLPKLVPLTHQQLLAAAMFMKLEVPEAVPGARHLSALPLFHVAGLANLGYVLFTGGHLHVLGAFEPAAFVDELAARRIELTQLVPTLIRAVTDEVAGRAERPDLSALTEIVYGASPIRPDLLERAVRVLGCRFRQNYASSETGPLPISSLSPADHDPARGLLGTAGRPSLGWEVRLGDRGEIQVRGGGSFWAAYGPRTLDGPERADGFAALPLPGYWGNPAATAAAFTADGFYRTGDVGTIDAAGYLTIVDRLRDVIITGGENVFPAEVEAVLAAHPAVADVAVIGVPDERWGERVHAVVVPRAAEGARAGAEADGRLDEAALLAFARSRLAGFKCPAGVTVAAALPRNATGKVLRAALREPFWAGQDRRVS